MLVQDILRDIWIDSQRWASEPTRPRGSAFRQYSDSTTAKRRIYEGPTRDATDKSPPTSIPPTQPPTYFPTTGSPSADLFTPSTSIYKNLDSTTPQETAAPSASMNRSYTYSPSGYDVMTRTTSRPPFAVSTEPNGQDVPNPPESRTQDYPITSGPHYPMNGALTGLHHPGTYNSPYGRPYVQPQPTRAIKSDPNISKHRSAPTLGTFQSFCVYRPRHASDRAPQSVPCTAILDACAFGPDNNSVSAYFLQEFGVIMEEESVIKLRIVAIDDGPVEKGLEYHEKFTVKDRRNAPLLLGREWIEKRWEDCTFFTLKAGSKTKRKSPLAITTIAVWIFSF